MNATKEIISKVKNKNPFENYIYQRKIRINTLKTHYHKSHKIFNNMMDLEKTDMQKQKILDLYDFISYVSFTTGEKILDIRAITKLINRFDKKDLIKSYNKYSNNLNVIN